MSENNKKNGLCGFLSPNGIFKEAAPYEHMEIATEIVEKKYGQTLSGIESERLLLEKGYIGFYSRDVGFQWFVNHSIRPLTDKQVTFVVENMKYANNTQQKQSIQELLERNDDVKSKNILDIVTLGSNPEALASREPFVVNQAHSGSLDP
jgi:hypothetical protein